MALPSAATPKYKLVIPSLKKSVTYRQFLVKEEKALLIAQHSEDPDVMLDTLKGVIASCITEKINVDDLALFDVEYIFAQLRAKSVGEIVDLVLKCDTCTDPLATVKYSIDLTKLSVDIAEGHDKKILLFDDVGVIMKYPSFSMIKRMEGIDTDNIDGLFEVICLCIEAVYNSEEMFYARDQSMEELRDFVNNLTQTQFKKLQRFFDTMPKLEQRVVFKCPLCHKDHDKMIRGLDSFF
jgi:hypothetical protein